MSAGAAGAATITPIKKGRLVTISAAGALESRKFGILRVSGLPFDRKHMLHCMRRSTASFYEAAGGNATDLLDHSSRDITKKFYLDTRVLPMTGPAMMEFRPKAG